MNSFIIARYFAGIRERKELTNPRELRRGSPHSIVDLFRMISFTSPTELSALGSPKAVPPRYRLNRVWDYDY